MNTLPRTPRPSDMGIGLVQMGGLQEGGEA